MHRFVAVSLICLLISASTRAGILELESEFRTAYQDMIGANHTVAVADLECDNKNPRPSKADRRER